MHPARTGPTKGLPWESHSVVSQHQAVISLNCVCEHLCFISIYCAPSCFYYYISVILGMTWSVIVGGLGMLKIFPCQWYSLPHLMPCRLAKGFIGVLYFWIEGDALLAFSTLSHSLVNHSDNCLASNLTSGFANE